MIEGELFSPAAFSLNLKHGTCLQGQHRFLLVEPNLLQQVLQPGHQALVVALLVVALRPKVLAVEVGLQQARVWRLRVEVAEVEQQQA